MAERGVFEKSAALRVILWVEQDFDVVEMRRDGGQVYTPGMTLKNAAFFAFIGMTLLTVVCALGFIGDISALLAGAIAAMTMLNSLIHLLASLSVAVFLYVFQRTQA